MVDKKDVMMVVMMVETTDKMSELLAVMKFAML